MTPPHDARPAAPLVELRGAVWMLGAVASFSAMALGVRSLTATLSVYQVLFLRSAVHICGQLGWIYAISVLPFALVFAIEFTTPLWGVVLAALVLREHPTRPQQLGLLIGLAGILVIVRPGPAGLSWDVLFMLAAALAFAATFLATRVLGRTDAPVAIPFWMCVLQTPPGLVLALTAWRPVTLAHWPAILLIAAGGLAAHQCMSMAVRLAPLARIMPIDYLRLPLIAVVGALFYAEPYDPFVLSGGAVVIAGVLLSQLRPRRRASGAPAP